MSSRQDRIQALADAVSDYVKKEKERITNEVQVMEAIVQGRGAGSGDAQKKVSAVAYNDLSAYLSGR
jgi:hypothetical protein